MTSRRWFRLIAALLLVLVPADLRGARGQLAGYPSISRAASAAATGRVPSGATAAAPRRVWHPHGPGRVGIRIDRRPLPAGLRVQRAQTTVALQPLYSAITSLPGWDGPTRRVRRRVRPRPVEAPVADARPQRQDPLAQHDPRRPDVDRPAQGGRGRRPGGRPRIEVDRPRLDPAGHRRQAETLGLRTEDPARDQGPECHRGRRPGAVLRRAGQGPRRHEQRLQLTSFRTPPQPPGFPEKGTSR